MSSNLSKDFIAEYRSLVFHRRRIGGSIFEQYMMYTRMNLTPLELKVKLPILLEIYNRNTVDLINNWTVGGRTTHVQTRQFFLSEVKEKGFLR